MQTSILVLPMYPHICKTTCASTHSEYNVLVELTNYRRWTNHNTNASTPDVSGVQNWELNFSTLQFLLLANRSKVWSPHFLSNNLNTHSLTSQSSKSNTLLYKSASTSRKMQDFTQSSKIEKAIFCKSIFMLPVFTILTTFWLSV